MKESPFEIKPRWKNAPFLCVAENLPAFKTRKEMDKFHEENCIDTSAGKVWKCESCGFFHYSSKPK
jgi:rubrerythrin